MKIVNQSRTGVFESEGFFIRTDIGEYSIIDSKTRLELGAYDTREQALLVFDEMRRNFIRPDRECYIMPR